MSDAAEELKALREEVAALRKEVAALREAVFPLERQQPAWPILPIRLQYDPNSADASGVWRYPESAGWAKV